MKKAFQTLRESLSTPIEEVPEQFLKKPNCVKNWSSFFIIYWLAGTDAHCAPVKV